jgi:hypothetical protein
VSKNPLILVVQPLDLIIKRFSKILSTRLKPCVFILFSSSFDIGGRVTGFGNPDWARTHAPAGATSPVVLAALAAGAISIGKTVMDEMAYR